MSLAARAPALATIRRMSSEPAPGARQASARGGAFGAIVAAAVDCFYEKGYEATGVQEIVSRARVSKGSFYHHFAAKEDLLLLIHDTFIDGQLEMLRSAASAGRAPRETLARLIEDNVVGAERFQRYQTIFFEQRRFLSEDRFVEVKKKRDEYEQQVVAILEAGIADGSFRPVASAQVMAFGIIGMSAWAYQWYRPGPLSARDIGRMYARVVLDGLTRPADRPSDQGV